MEAKQKPGTAVDVMGAGRVDERSRRGHNGGPALLTSDPKFLELQRQLALFARAGAELPYFRQHDGANSHCTTIAGRTLINFSSYNYLGLSGDAEISAAAKLAIDKYGTSVSASRIVSGEISLHRELEHEIAQLLNVESALLYVSGHATNVSTIGHLFADGDLVLSDALAHNSITEGCKLSGAKHVAFAHNNPEHLDHLLKRLRPRYRKTLIVVEGVYSMDGDIAELPRFIELKREHHALLMVDEAHSLGVLGARGRGIGEHFGLHGQEVDLWMGTLSKSLASCGGYIAGSNELVQYLKFTSPSFVFSVGMPPASAAAALSAVRRLLKEPERVHTLHERSRLFVQLAGQRGLNTGLSAGTPVVPVIVGDSLLALRLSHELADAGVNVQPIIYPAVANHAARLRFFISAEHSVEQIQHTVDATAVILSRLRAESSARTAAQ